MPPPLGGVQLNPPHPCAGVLKTSHNSCINSCITFLHVFFACRNPHAELCRSSCKPRRGLTLPPSRRPRASRRATILLFFVCYFSRFFFVFKKTHEFGKLSKWGFCTFFLICWPSGVDFHRFWVPKRASGGSSGGVFRPLFPDAVLH